MGNSAPLPAAKGVGLECVRAPVGLGRSPAWGRCGSLGFGQSFSSPHRLAQPGSAKMLRASGRKTDPRRNQKVIPRYRNRDGWSCLSRSGEVVGKMKRDVFCPPEEDSGKAARAA